MSNGTSKKSKTSFKGQNTAAQARRTAMRVKIAKIRDSRKSQDIPF